MKNRRNWLLVALLSLVATTLRGQHPGLLLSELLFQPRSGEAEYVELYNPTAEAIDLADYLIIRWQGGTLGTHYPLPSHRVAPHDYVVITKDAASVVANYAGIQLHKMVECNLPPYPNGGGTVVLATAEGDVVEQLDYTPAMHSRLLRNKAGVSLERRRFDRPCNEASNWFSAASTAGYGTPTQANSQSAEHLVEEIAFTLSSDVISPNGDGYQDDLTIDYALDSDDIYATIDIYDGGGHPVRKLLNNSLLGTHGSIPWDGLDGEGNRLHQGRYILVVQLYTLMGTRQTLRRHVSVVNQ